MKISHKRLVTMVLVCLFLGAAATGLCAQRVKWEHRWDGPGALSNSDIGKGICVGPGGDIYWTGQTSVDTNGTSDMLIQALSPEGTVLWTYLYHGGAFDMGYSIAADADGNIYAAGNSRLLSGNNRFTIVSVDQMGDFRWVYHWIGDSYAFWASHVKVGADGNIYACGQGRLDPQFDENMAIVSVTPSGQERWKVAYPVKSTGVAWKLDIGPGGHVYAAGTTGSNFAVVSVTRDGTPRWMYRYTGSAGGPFGGAEAVDLAVGGDGNIYAVGEASEIGRDVEFTVISIDPHGNERWLYQYNGSANVHDNGLAICWGTDGNVYAAGKSVEGGGDDAMTIISLTPSGQERWVSAPTYNGYNGIWSVVTDRDGNVYGAGWIGASATPLPLLGVRSMTSDGRSRWEHQVSSSGSGLADQVVLGEGSTIHVVGFTQDPVMSAQGVVLTLETSDIFLDQSELRRGRPAWLEATAAGPNEKVYFLLSAAGTGFGPAVPALGGLHLGILAPVRLVGSATANASGTATLTGTVPAGAPLVTVYTQAVIQRGAGGAESVKSNTKTTPILP